MPKANELDLIPVEQQLPDRILVIADPATGELYKIPASLLATIIGAGRFGIEDNTSSVDRLINMGNNNFLILNAKEADLLTFDGVKSAQVISSTVGQDGDTTSFVRIGASENINNSKRYIKVTPNDIRFKVNDDAENYLPLSVNNVFAGPDGNITLEGGGGADTNFATTDLTATGDRAHYFSDHALNITGLSRFEVIRGTENSGVYSKIQMDSGDIFIQTAQAGSYYTLAVIAGKASVSAVTPTGRKAVDVDGNAVNIRGPLLLSKDTSLLECGAEDYPNNAAAVSAGLTIGAVYRTGDVLKIVHD